MKVTREQAAANRQRVVDAAAELFKERGFDGVGVAEVTAAAGLTHGGFYGQFASKEELMAEAVGRALDGSAERWAGRIAAADSPEAALAAVVTAYLSAEHRDRPGGGCLLAALGPEAARHRGPVRRRVTEGARALFDLLADIVPGRGAAARRRKALATYAGLVGGLVLARAVDDATLSDEILSAVAESLLGKGSCRRR